MIIEYKNKITKDIKDGCIDAKLIEYEITKTDLQQLALTAQNDETYKINRIFLFKDNVSTLQPRLFKSPLKLYINSDGNYDSKNVHYNKYRINNILFVQMIILEYFN